MAYRLYSKLQTFHGITGQVLASGELRFFASDEITPKAVYTDSTGSVSNGSVIDLDASGRPNVEMWGTGDYFVQVVDSLGAVQGSEVVTQGGGSGIPAIPIPIAGEFLTGDGLNILAATIRELPDPTGLDGKILMSDGGAWIASNMPTLPTLPMSSVTGGFTIDGKLYQVGTGTFPIPTTTPPHESSLTISFPTAFTAVGGVIVNANKSIIATNGYKPVCVADSITNSGFTAIYNTNYPGLDAAGNVTVTVPFSWIAWGTKAP